MSPLSKLTLWICSFLLLWMVLVMQLGAHDAGGWQYPSICCHDADCAPVEWQGELNGHGVANTKLHAGITTEPNQYTYKMTSPDGKMHVCATPDKSMAPNMQRRLYCIFNPAGM